MAHEFATKAAKERWGSPADRRERYRKDFSGTYWYLKFNADAAILADAYMTLLDDARLKCPLDGPGSHRADLKELRLLHARQVAVERLLDVAKDAVDCVDEEDKRDALRAAIAALETEIKEPQ